VSGRVALVVGVANRRSLATAIARELADQGWQLAFTWQEERVRDRVEAVRDSVQAEAWCGRLDVDDDTSIQTTIDALRDRHGWIHGLVHSIAFARLADADGDTLRVLDCDRERFAQALRISAHSLPALSPACYPLFADDAAVVALSYLGAVRALAGYNVMGVAKAALESTVRYAALELGASGVRVNALRAGPIRTLAASGVPGFRERLAEHAARSPLARNVDAEEVARVAAFLLSPAASGITGACLDVDAGASIVG